MITHFSGLLKKTGKCVVCVVLAAASLPLASFAQQAAQTDRFLNRPLRAVATSGPGSSVDIVARLVGNKLSELLGQPVIVDNRSGASGIVGMQIVAEAEPNGQTIAIVPAAYVLNPSFYAKLPFDTFRDFAPITLLATQASVLVVHPSVIARSVKELIALAKSKPGQLNYSSSGIGNGAHLSMALFCDMAGLDIAHIPYKGGGAASSAALSGEVQMAIIAAAVVTPHVKTGKLRALGISGKNRISGLPNVPTISEAGVPGYEAYTWNGVLAPARTPQSIVDRLYGAISTALKSLDLRGRLVAMDYEVNEMTPAEFAAYARSEHDKWAKVIKASGIRLTLPE